MNVPRKDLPDTDTSASNPNILRAIHGRALTRIWTLAAAVATSLGALLPLLLDWPKPYVIAFIGAALWFITIAFGIARRPVMQNVCVLLATVSLCLATAELGAWIVNASRPQMTTNTLEFNYDDTDLGYSPKPIAPILAGSNERG